MVSDYLDKNFEKRIAKNLKLHTNVEPEGGNQILSKLLN